MKQIKGLKIWDSAFLILIDCMNTDYLKKLMRRNKMKLNITAFALTSALFWGFGLFFLTWWIMIFEGTTGEITLIGQIYRGYSISPIGSIFGLIWGFFDALIGGAIFAWLYNLLAGRLSNRQVTK